MFTGFFTYSLPSLIFFRNLFFIYLYYASFRFNRNYIVITSTQELEVGYIWSITSRGKEYHFERKSDISIESGGDAPYFWKVEENPPVVRANIDLTEDDTIIITYKEQTQTLTLTANPNHYDEYSKKVPTYNLVNEVFMTNEYAVEHFASVEHTHEGYALVDHTHDDLYAPLEHTHEEYATKEELAQLPTIDTSNLATKEELNNKADINHTHDDYALTSHTHDDYALTSHTHDDLYAPISHTHSEYATKEELAEISALDVKKTYPSPEYTGSVFDEFNSDLFHHEVNDKSITFELRSVFQYEEVETLVIFNGFVICQYENSDFLVNEGRYTIEPTQSVFDELGLSVVLDRFDLKTCRFTIYYNDNKEFESQMTLIVYSEHPEPEMTEKIAFNLKKTYSTIPITDSVLTVQALIDLFYPIGSIYMSMSDIPPANRFGGTWEQITDTFLYCADSSGETGGSNKITVENLPAHSHTFKGNAIQGNFGFAADTGLGSPWSDSITNGPFSTAFQTANRVNYSEGEGYSFQFNATPSGTISKTGSGEDYMPPYLTVYAWKRTG